MSTPPNPPDDTSGADEFGSLSGGFEAGWDGQDMTQPADNAPRSDSSADKPEGESGLGSKAQDEAEAESEMQSGAESGTGNAPPQQGDNNAGAPADSSSPPPAPRAESAPAQPAAQTEDGPGTAKAMTLMDHLGELRTRLVRSAIAVALAFAACYGVADLIFGELMRPLLKALPPNSKLIFTALPEAFFVYLQVGFVTSIFLASPYLFYQIWGFISPGLYDEEKKHAIPLALFSAFFFLLGAAFCYFVVFPFSFTFFMGFATDDIVPMPSLSEYLGFALKMLIAFGLIFEMPLFTFFLSRMGLVTAQGMRRVRRYAVLVIFIVAAILTPPDVMSQMLMAIPMLLLYECSIFIAVSFGKKPKTKTEDEQPAAETATNPQAAP